MGLTISVLVEWQSSIIHGELVEELRYLLIYIHKSV